MYKFQFLFTSLIKIIINPMLLKSKSEFSVLVIFQTYMNAKKNSLENDPTKTLQ